MKEKLNFMGMGYAVSYPKSLEKDKKYPVIIFLHGVGTRGNNLDMLFENPYFQITDKYSEFPFITVAPQCSEDTWFDMFEKLKGLVKHIYDMPFTDKNRIYVMGASMGGYATWQLAMSMPEYFAAIVPICGGGMYWNAYRLSALPVWAFHGAKDDCVFAEESRKIVDAVNKNGGNAKLTVYPENSHDAWSDTYGNHKVFEWLLTNTNKNEKIQDGNFSDINIYG